METLKTHFKGFRLSPLFVLTALVFTALQSCRSDKNQTSNAVVENENDGVVEVITEAMEFQMPDTIASGWNNFHYINRSPQTHFFLIEEYPEGKTLEDANTLVIPVFTTGMKLINEGKTEEAMAEFGKLPQWYGDVVFRGGSGLISPGHTAENTLKLDPGYYIIECYVKMSNGVFHSSMGMTKALVVSDEESGNAEAKADIAIDISSDAGIQVTNPTTSGRHVFSVSFKDQKAHEHFVGHDVNLVKLDEEADLKALEAWMNWVDPKGLIEPAPDGVTFLGGVNDMPAGGKGYFTADLEAGQYALISEVPKASKKNMLKTFMIAE